MKIFLCLCLLFLFVTGCRISVTAEKLSLSVQADEPGYLAREEVTLYTDEPTTHPDPIE